MTITVVTLVTRTEDTDEESFDRHWSGPHAELVSRLPGLRSYTQSIPHPTARRPQAFDGVAAVDFDDLDGLRAATSSSAYQEVRADEDRFVNRSTLVTLVVERHEVTLSDAAEPEPDAVKFFGFMRRRSGMGHSAFLAHWRGRHAALAGQLPGLQRYVHDVPVSLRGQPAYDGAAELWFPSLAVLVASFRTDVGRAVRADEQAFVDAETSFALQLTERRII